MCVQYPKASLETSGHVREVGRGVIDSQKEAGSAGSKGLDKMQTMLLLTGAALARPGLLWNTQVQASDNRGRRSCWVMRMFICSLGLPDILRLRGGAELALEPAMGGLGVGGQPSRQPLSLSASLDFRDTPGFWSLCHSQRTKEPSLVSASPGSSGPRGFSPRGTLGTGRIPCLQLGPVVLPRSHILIDVGPFLLGGT